MLKFLEMLKCATDALDYVEKPRTFSMLPKNMLISRVEVKKQTWAKPRAPAI